MTTANLDSPDPRLRVAEIALMVADHVPAMLAYWDADQRCRFANNAYRDWFGKAPDEIVGRTMRELLGPLYDLNLPYIERALAGERQVFERAIPLPNGTVRDSIATYTPDIADGVVLGFTVQVADVTAMKQLEASLRAANRELEASVALVRELRSIVPICAYCKSVRTDQNYWQKVEAYLRDVTVAEISHGICPSCYERVMGEPG